MKHLLEYLISGDIKVHSSVLTLEVVWMTIFFGLWDLTALPDHKEMLYAHRIATARYASERYSTLFAHMYSASEIGFQGEGLELC